MRRFFSLTLFVLLSIIPAVSQDQPVRYDFAKATAAENGITVMGPGFGSMPEAEVTFGALPTDNAFAGATDGTGMVVQADPGEGVMVLTGPIQTSRCALVRASVRASGDHVSVYLATIDQGQNSFVSTLTPNNGGFFAGRYNRLADVFLPPSTGFQALMQIVNTSPTEPLTVYVDNLEALPSASDRLDFAVSDLVAGAVQPTPTPKPPTPTLTPIPPTPLVTPTSPPTNPQILTINLSGLPAQAKPLELVYIPAGSFAMGSPSNETDRGDNEGPQHQVTLTKPFYLGKYEVTQAQWQAVMGSNPSYFKGNNLPVENVSLNDCQSFIQKLNQMGQGTFRLPTEAEWEYACRAGTATRFYWGNDSGYSQIGQYAWYTTNASNLIHEVGGKQPNAWGVFDMSGNVWEWCQDWYGLYSSGASTDPTGAKPGNYRVIRGGSWSGNAKYCRSAIRLTYSPDSSDYDVGVRLVRTP